MRRRPKAAAHRQRSVSSRASILSARCGNASGRCEMTSPLLERLFSTDGFMPHGMCYLWQPGVLALHVVSDGLITVAYFSIPATLLYIVRERTQLQFNW